jgi:putative hydrolase of the HAD superfamily
MYLIRKSRHDGILLIYILFNTHNVGMKQIKAITFGLDGTLAYGALDSESYQKELVNYLRKIGYSEGKGTINKARQAMLEKMKRHQARNIELRFDLLYSNMLFDLGLEITQERLEHIEDLYNRFYTIDVFPGVKEMLEDLNGKYHLAIVANAITNVSRLALEKLDLAKYFDYIVLSRDLGARKPDPEIFIYALRSMWIKAGETVHVGASLQDDVQGAKDAGMKTVWIKGNEEVTDIQPDFVISKVTELPSLL